jgi:hypothetical protein
MLQILGFSMLHKKIYSKNYEMAKFMMIPEPYITQAISPKVYGLRS